MIKSYHAKNLVPKIIFFLLQESTDSLKDRMSTLENDIRKLQEQLSTQSNDADADTDKKSVDGRSDVFDNSDLSSFNNLRSSPTLQDGRAASPTFGQMTSPTMMTTEMTSTTASTSSLRRTRLRPRRFRKTNSESPDFEVDEDVQEDEQDESK